MLYQLSYDPINAGTDNAIGIANKGGQGLIKRQRNPVLLNYVQAPFALFGYVLSLTAGPKGNGCRHNLLLGQVGKCPNLLQEDVYLWRRAHVQLNHSALGFIRIHKGIVAQLLATSSTFFN